MNPDTAHKIAEDIQLRLKALHYKHSDKPFRYPGTHHIANSILQTLGLADATDRQELLKWFPLYKESTDDESLRDVPAKEATKDRTHTTNRIERRDRRSNTDEPTDSQHEGEIESSVRSSTVGQDVPQESQEVD